MSGLGNIVRSLVLGLGILCSSPAESHTPFRYKPILPSPTFLQSDNREEKKEVKLPRIVVGANWRYFTADASGIIQEVTTNIDHIKIEDEEFFEDTDLGRVEAATFGLSLGVELPELYVSSSFEISHTLALFFNRNLVGDGDTKEKGVAKQVEVPGYIQGILEEEMGRPVDKIDTNFKVFADMKYLLSAGIAYKPYFLWGNKNLKYGVMGMFSTGLRQFEADIDLRIWPSNYILHEKFKEVFDAEDIRVPLSIKARGAMFFVGGGPAIQIKNVRCAIGAGYLGERAWIETDGSIDIRGFHSAVDVNQVEASSSYIFEGSCEYLFNNQ